MDPSDAGYYEEPNYYTTAKVKSQNFDLGKGDPNWLSNFAAGQKNTQAAANDLRGQGRSLASDAKTDTQRTGAGASYGTANTTLGQAQQTLRTAGNQGQNQADVAGQLLKFAQGPQGPSAAQAQLNKGTDAALTSQLAMARSGSGFGEGATALDAASRNASGTIAGAANDAAILKAQEDQNFKNQQMGALTGAAGMYQQQQAGTLAEAQQQQAIAAQQAGQSEFNANANLQNQAQNDALRLGLGSQSIDAQNAAMNQDLAAQGLTLNAQNADLQGRMAEEQANAQLYGTDADIYQANLQNQTDNRNLDQQFGRDVVGGVGSAVGAIGSLIGLSDVRAKTNIEPTSIANRYDDAKGDTGKAYRDYETEQSDDLLDSYQALQKRDDDARKKKFADAFSSAGKGFQDVGRPLSQRSR